MENLNIINLIENNPIKKLTTSYNNKLLEKIKENFTLLEQQLFIASFYCYLNYDENDFIIDLDNIWNWLGFSQKIRLKELLEKYFILDKHYKILPSDKRKQKNSGRGGHNKEIIMLNIETFKLLCIKANTKKDEYIYIILN